jgi:type I restriction-modification system DNA methylase subunit
MLDLLRAIQSRLNAGDLRESLMPLFCETLRWGQPQGHPLTLSVGAPVNRSLILVPIAQLSGLPVFRVDWHNTQLPRLTERRAVYRALTPIYREHLLCYVTENGKQTAFVWARERDAKKVELRVLPYELGSPARTTIERLRELAFTLDELAMGEPPVTKVIDKLNAAFDVEAVNEDFFEQYEACFHREVKPAVKKALDGDDESAHQFTQLLFNRLMFCWFLQKKGWLGGDPYYLLNLLRRAHNYKPPKNFYHDYLSFLFFEVLANPEEQRRKRQPSDPHIVMEAPFLNGGLFERTELDERIESLPTFRRLPNSIFKSILEDLFARYNFTVEESTSLDIQVALDPELLGTIFERLVTGRHETGSYYTPKPVVEFMCRQALKHYLAQETDLPETILEDLVENHSVENLSPAQANDIIRVLDTIKVCDPACGSGAYLVTMLHELVAIYRALYSEKLNDPQKDYDLKLRIIERNLYGVDIDPFAVHIARLRLWLTLIVDSEETDWRRVKPLPNLDFKIEIGDSLTAPNPQAMPDLFRSVLIQHADRLAQLKGKYLRAYGEEKRRLERQIKDEESQLRDALRDSPAPQGALDWRIAFAEVFAEKQGFDIVLANPPYVRQELIPQAYKQLLLSLYPDAAEGRSDLYVYFYARALQLLRPSGIHVFICSNSWLDVAYGGKLQKHLLENAHILAIYESALERQFTSAAINTIISFLRKGRPDDAAETRFIRLLDAFEKSVTDPSRQRIVVKTRAELWQEGSDESGRYVGNKWGGKYLRAPDIFFTILEKGKGKLVPLGEIAEVRRGFTTGANEFFYLQPVGMSVKDVVELQGIAPTTPVRVRNDAGWEGEIEAGWLHPVIKSPREIRTLRVRLEDLSHLLFMPPKEVREGIRARNLKPLKQYPNALAYIRWGERQGYHQRPTCKSRNPWWDVGERTPAMVNCNYLIDDRMRFYFAPNGVYVSDDFQELRGANEVHAAIASATVTQMFCELRGRTPFGGGLLKVQTYEVKSLPILNPSLLVSVHCQRLLSAFHRLCERPVRSIFEELGFELCRKRRCNHPEHPYEQVTPEALTLEQVQRASPDRFELDAVIFDVLGLTDDERLAVYKAVAQLVKDRLVKARSV